MTIAVRRREEELKEKWDGVNDLVPVNESQYSLDSEDREEAYIRAQFKTEDELTRYRWYREEWYRRAKEFDPGEIPLSVTCELVSTCNLGCSMCYTITPEFQNTATGAQRMLPWPVVKSVIDEAAALGVPSMLFSWRGESTLYRWKDGDRVIRFPDVLAYARQKGILEVTSLTHGQLIDAEMAEGIVAAEPNWISVSIDGLGETYNKVRTPPGKSRDEHDAFTVVIENIQRLVAIRNAQGKTRPQIRTNTVYPAIADDLDAYKAKMQEIGVGWLTINELLDFRGATLPPEAIRADWACQYPFQRLTVSAGGTVLPCTGTHREEAALVMGRYRGAAPKVLRDIKGAEMKVEVPEVSLIEAWNSPKLKQLREMHKNNQRHLISPGCRSCRHGAVKHGVEWMPDDWDRENMRWKQGIWRL
jgi:MoaA/NifB/PqqE/SkfB family radical SAM enzyme